MNNHFQSILILIFFSVACSSKSGHSGENTEKVEKDSTAILSVDEVRIEKQFLYDQYTLDDTYPYEDTTRVFQWKKIKSGLFLLDSIQSTKTNWGILKNYKNRNGLPRLAQYACKNDYNHATDTFGIEQAQAIPLYKVSDTLEVERYDKDGSLVEIKGAEGNFVKVSALYRRGDWLIPKKYLEVIGDTILFKKVIFIDRTNQNICTLEKNDSVWLVRSMNPATTGLRRPPYKYPTPIGIFVIQEKTRKMVYLADGSHAVGGFSPWANRFSCGAYIHGVPIDLPHTKEVEYSKTLGTTPRSHKCVRTATSHAEFIYNWAPSKRAVVFVFD